MLKFVNLPSGKDENAFINWQNVCIMHLNKEIVRLIVVEHSIH